MKSYPTSVYSLTTSGLPTAVDRRKFAWYRDEREFRIDTYYHAQRALDRRRIGFFTKSLQGDVPEFFIRGYSRHVTLNLSESVSRLASWVSL